MVEQLATALLNPSACVRTILDEHFQNPQDVTLAPALLKKILHECSNLQHAQRHLQESLAQQAQCAWDEAEKEASSLREIASQLQRSFPRSGALRTMASEFLPIGSEIKLMNKASAYFEAISHLEACILNAEDAVSSALPDRHYVLQKSTMEGVEFSAEDLLHAVNSFRSSSDAAAEVARNNPKWTRLLSAIHVRLDQIAAKLKPNLIAAFRLCLATGGWPPGIALKTIESDQTLSNLFEFNSEEIRHRFENCFTAIIVFQVVENQRKQLIGASRASSSDLKLDSSDDLLWGISEMVSPIVAKSRLHFSKWFDRPELIFALLYEVARRFTEPIEESLQPLIDGAHLSSCYLVEEWIKAMSDAAMGQLKYNILPYLAESIQRDPHSDQHSCALFLHTVDEVLAFDSRMLDLASRRLHSLPVEGNIQLDFAFSGSTEALVLGRNISPCINALCINEDWFEIWTLVELQEAEKRLHDELMHESSWKISPGIISSFPNFDIIDPTGSSSFHRGVFESSLFMESAANIKRPNGADFVMGIAHELADRCNPLTSLKFKKQFVENTILEILRIFVQELYRRCREIEASTALSSFTDLEKICSCLNAAYYCEFVLQNELCNEIMFLELAQYYGSQGNGENNAGAVNSVDNMDEEDDGDGLVGEEEGWAGIDLDLKIDDEDKDKFDADNNECPSKDDIASDEGDVSLFSDVISEFGSFRNEWMMKIVTSLARNFSSRCRAYFNDTNRWSIEPELTDFQTSQLNVSLSSSQSVVHGDEAESSKVSETTEKENSLLVREPDHFSVDSPPVQPKSSNLTASGKQVIVMDEGVNAASPKLLYALALLEEDLDSINSIVAWETFHEIRRSLAKTIEDAILENIPFRGIPFSATGICRFFADMDALFSMFRRFSVAETEILFKAINDVIIVLKLDDSLASSVLQRLNLVKFSFFEKFASSRSEFDCVCNIDSLMNQLGVSVLDIQQVRKLLQSRVDLKNL